jgi:signal peptidase I
MKLLKNTIYTLIIGAYVALAAILLSSNFSLPYSLKIYSVQSGSMEPAIRTGSLVFTTKPVLYHIGDIITFSSEAETNQINPQATTTHRLIDIVTDNGTQVFRTKGDANQSADASLVDPKRVIGRVSLSLPYLGYVATFAKTQEGLIFLVIVPATIIVYSELLNIKTELKKLFKRKEHN